MIFRVIWRASQQPRKVFHFPPCIDVRWLLDIRLLTNTILTAMGSFLISVSLLLLHFNSVMGFKAVPPGTDQKLPGRLEKDGWIYSPHTRKHYKLVHRPATQPEAKADCKRMNGTLVRIDSHYENKFLYEHSKRSHVKHGRWQFRHFLWIGLERRCTDWTATTGEKITYFNWGASERNNYIRSENCVVFDRRVGDWCSTQWIDLRCNQKVAGYWCQRNF
ncbi:hypothetical protein Q1695_015530 [Nippostrongylus brasiliensis]|nr:hypothetical protein Q1695_015530 [Nippostrongylus brasiliensis]